jgi:hypothetical protein
MDKVQIGDLEFTVYKHLSPQNEVSFLFSSKDGDKADLCFSTYDDVIDNPTLLSENIQAIREVYNELAKPDDQVILYNNLSEKAKEWYGYLNDAWMFHFDVLEIIMYDYDLNRYSTIINFD